MNPRRSDETYALTRFFNYSRHRRAGLAFARLRLHTEKEKKQADLRAGRRRDAFSAGSPSDISGGILLVSVLASRGCGFRARYLCCDFAKMRGGKRAKKRRRKRKTRREKAGARSCASFAAGESLFAVCESSQPDRSRNG